MECNINDANANNNSILNTIKGEANFHDINGVEYFRQRQRCGTEEVSLQVKLCWNNKPWCRQDNLFFIVSAYTTIIVRDDERSHLGRNYFFLNKDGYYHFNVAQF